MNKTLEKIFAPTPPQILKHIYTYTEDFKGEYSTWPSKIILDSPIKKTLEKHDLTRQNATWHESKSWLYLPSTTLEIVSTTELTDKELEIFRRETTNDQEPTCLLGETIWGKRAISFYNPIIQHL